MSTNKASGCPTRYERLLTLTPAQERVAKLAMRGFTNGYIARHLHLSQRTVYTHITQIYSKLNVVSRDTLIEAYGLMLVPTPAPVPAASAIASRVTR